MLRAVTFDFWSTLFADPRGREREALRSTVLADALAAAGLQASGQALDEGLRAAWDHFDSVWLREHRTPSCAELVDAILRSLRVQLPDDLLQPLVERFAGRYRLAIICDTGYSPGAVLRELLERHDMLAHFEYTYFSNEHGMSKPDTRVFIHVLEELGVRPAEAAHVGDIQRTDIAGAQAAGMSAVHFVGANNTDVAHSTGDVMVSHFEELPQALGGLICAGC